MAPEVSLPCTQLDPELFFPEPYVRIAPLAVIEACSRCELQSQCLESALARNEKHGVWGGLTLYQRKQIDRTIVRIKCPGCAATEVFTNEADSSEVCLCCGLSWKI